jgi:hypothetical protein
MPDRRGARRCSFCGKTEGQVRGLVAGPGIYICNECVYLCVEVLKERHIADETPQAERSAALEVEIRHLHGLLRLESQLVKDLREETERLTAKAGARNATGRRTRALKS